ncbi:MAG: efflux RND transporter periplasmic adaptor subunit [Clostridiales bacterium]
MKYKTTIILLIIITVSFYSCKKENNIVLSGSIESEQTDIISTVDGKVNKISKDEGNKVLKNDLILEVDSRNEKLNIEKQEIMIKIQESKLEEIEDSINDNKKEQLDLEIKQSKLSLQQMELILDNYEIKSPIEGYYQNSTIKEGEFVKKSMILGTIVNLDNLWVNLYLPQKHLSKVNLNSEIKLYTSNKKNINGKVTYISDKAEFTPKNIETNEAKENTVFRVKVEIEKMDHLKPGMSIFTEL